MPTWMTSAACSLRPGAINPKLVRGLDYYSKTVFEWVTDKLGAQGTVCAGGRYDGHVEQMGGKPTTGVGFAMGIERLILLLETLEQVPEEISRQVDVYLCAFGEAAELAALALSEKVRDQLPNLRLQINAGAGSFKSQFTALHMHPGLIAGQQRNPGTGQCSANTRRRNRSMTSVSTTA